MRCSMGIFTKSNGQIQAIIDEARQQYRRDRDLSLDMPNKINEPVELKKVVKALADDYTSLWYRWSRQNYHIVNDAKELLESGERGGLGPCGNINTFLTRVIEDIRISGQLTLDGQLYRSFAKLQTLIDVNTHVVGRSLKENVDRIEDLLSLAEGHKPQASVYPPANSSSTGEGYGASDVSDKPPLPSSPSAGAENQAAYDAFWRKYPSPGGSNDANQETKDSTMNPWNR